MTYLSFPKRGVRGKPSSYVVHCLSSFCRHLVGLVRNFASHLSASVLFHLDRPRLCRTRKILCPIYRPKMKCGPFDKNDDNRKTCVLLPLQQLYSKTILNCAPPLSQSYQQDCNAGKIRTTGKHRPVSPKPKSPSLSHFLFEHRPKRKARGAPPSLLSFEVGTP
jgi:hypothetical protein